jgi:hypothetical protein
VRLREMQLSNADLARKLNARSKENTMRNSKSVFELIA